MDDIVERLREYATEERGYGGPCSLVAEAADEIERLRAAVDSAHHEGWTAAKMSLKEDGAPRLTVIKGKETVE